MSKAAIDEMFIAKQGQPLNGGNTLSPLAMNPKFRINATEILADYSPDTTDQEIDEEDLLESREIEFISPVRIRKKTTLFGLELKVVEKTVIISLPPGGKAKLKNGTIVVNELVEGSSVSMFAFCPKCSEWWVKRTAGRPRRCPNCMERLDKYKLQEIELKEVLEQAVKEGRKRI